MTNAHILLLYAGLISAITLWIFSLFGMRKLSRELESQHKELMEKITQLSRLVSN